MNRYFISDALDKAVELLKIRLKKPISIIPGGGASSQGCQRIDEVIQKNIAESTVFVCDITAINIPSLWDMASPVSSYIADISENPRKCPNPNVMFELGFAVSSLTWNRVLPIINLAVSSIDALPFDLANRVHVTYSRLQPEEGVSKKQAVDQLAKVLENKIFNILKEYDTEIETEEIDIGLLGNFNAPMTPYDIPRISKIFGADDSEALGHQLIATRRSLMSEYQSVVNINMKDRDGLNKFINKLDNFIITLFRIGIFSIDTKLDVVFNIIVAEMIEIVQKECDIFEPEEAPDMDIEDISGIIPSFVMRTRIGSLVYSFALMSHQHRSSWVLKLLTAVTKIRQRNGSVKKVALAQLSFYDEFSPPTMPREDAIKISIKMMSSEPILAEGLATTPKNHRSILARSSFLISLPMLSAASFSDSHTNRSCAMVATQNDIEWMCDLIKDDFSMEIGITRNEIRRFIEAAKIWCEQNHTQRSSLIWPRYLQELEAYIMSLGQ